MSVRVQRDGNLIKKWAVASAIFVLLPDGRGREAVLVRKELKCGFLYLQTLET